MPCCLVCVGCVYFPCSYSNSKPSEGTSRGRAHCQHLDVTASRNDRQFHERFQNEYSVFNTVSWLDIFIWVFLKNVSHFTKMRLSMYETNTCMYFHNTVSFCFIRKCTLACSANYLETCLSICSHLLLVLVLYHCLLVCLKSFFMILNEYLTFMCVFIFQMFIRE